MATTTLIRKPKTQRERDARHVECAFCLAKRLIAVNPEAEPRTMAANFCGAWVNDGSNDERGRECLKPICEDCGDIRIQIWLCPNHGKKEKE
jgi:hypothetical protein